MKAKTLIVVLLLLATLPALAQPAIGPFPAFPKPSGSVHVRLMLGWYNNTQAWFGCISTNSIQWLDSTVFGRMVLTPKLSSALTPKLLGGPIAAQPVYVVTNFQNGPVFSTAPGQPSYSALWQIFTVTWLPGAIRRPICNALPASLANPTGLPGPSEAVIVATDAVVDCPIGVLGPFVKPGPAAGGYLIPQAMILDTYKHEISLRAYAIGCTDPVTKRCETAVAVITDAGDPALATTLGANLAPGLLNLPDSDTSDFFVMRAPKPPSQLPVVSDCAEFANLPFPSPPLQNINPNVSPVMRYIILQRNLPASVSVCSINTLEQFLANGCLTIVKSDQRINGAFFELDDRN